MKSIIEEAILSIKSKYRSILLNKKNVVGLGISKKYIKGINTNEPCLQVLVEKKVSTDELNNNDFIANNFLGIKTDVVETGIFSADSTNSNSKTNSNNDNVILKNNNLLFLSSYKRPLQPGYAISTKESKTFGTIGAIVYSFQNRKAHILSTATILTNGNTMKKGAKIIQPSSMHGCFKKSEVATLTEAIFPEYRKSKDDLETFNTGDFAIAEINNGIQVYGRLPIVGDINVDKEAIVGMQVQKIGAGSGRTFGEIISENVDLVVNYQGGKQANFRDQILTSNMTEKGDSGSLLLTIIGNYLLGICHTHSKTYSAFFPAKYSLITMNVSTFSPEFWQYVYN